jgi:hypothetical protein
MKYVYRFMLHFNVRFHLLNIENLSLFFHPSNTKVSVNKEIQKGNKTHKQQRVEKNKTLHRHNKQYEQIVANNLSTLA